MKPFSHEEHSAFLDGMERYGQESTGNEWEKIAQAVGSGRSAKEVRMHAHDYFVNLQMVTQMEPDARVLGSKVKREDWTFEQDMVFEHAMAEFDETDPLRWLKVASLLPGKNHEDVRHRYQRLIYDVHKIENAMPMEIKYKAPKAGKSLLAKVAAKSGSASGRGRGGLSKGSSSSFGSGGGVGGGVGGGAGGGSREEGTVKAPRVKGQGKGKLIHKTEPIEKEGRFGATSKPTKGPVKTKIKGKGGGYLLSNKSSSPRGSARGGSITSGPRGTPATIGTRGGPGSATAASKGGAAAASGPRGGDGSVGVGPRGGVVVANGPRGGGTSSGGKGLGVSSVARGGGVSGGARGGGATRGGSKTSSAAIGGVGPRGGAGGAASGGKGKGLSGGGSALKRSAVAHLANLKRARVDEDDSMRRTPVNEASSVFFSVFFILFSAVLRGGASAGGAGGGAGRGGKIAGGGAGGGGAVGDCNRRKSGRARKRKVLDGQADDEDDLDDDYQKVFTGHDPVHGSGHEVFESGRAVHTISTTTDGKSRSSSSNTLAMRGYGGYPGPIPGFRRWVDTRIAAGPTDAGAAGWLAAKEAGVSIRS
eukprot:jgi/Undpi1/10388/HiC_scaffold_29.g12838.m1